jgi:hypothetical protein
MKVVKLVMKQTLGVLTSNKTSSSIRDPLCAFCEVSHMCAQVFHILISLIIGYNGPKQETSNVS